MPAQPDYYEILQVHPSAEPEVVQAAYRRLSLKYHPDVYHGADAQQRMALLNEAYAVLSDPKRRVVYDRQRSGGRSAASPPLTPVLQVTPQELNLGAVSLGRSRTASIHVSNGGQGRLSGLVVSHVPWLQVSPAEFASNELDVVFRFRPSTPGEYGSVKAAEVYSNGGRATIAVRGYVQAGAVKEASPAAPVSPREGPVAKRPPIQVTRAPGGQIRVPFMVWVFLGTLVSTVVWFQIAPALAAVPVGLGIWLTWERLVIRQRPSTPKSDTQKGTRRRTTLARCLVCSAALDPSRARKCGRCGGAICGACGACACRGSGSHPPSPR